MVSTLKSIRLQNMECIVPVAYLGFQHGGGQGAIGAEGGDVRRGVPLPTGEGSEEGLCPSPEFFLYYWLKILYFDAFC